MTSTSSPSTAPTWPRQVTFPGQAAAPDGPVDMFMMYAMHHAFRRDLSDFATAVPGTPLGDRDRWQALQRRWELFATTLHRHHSGEDEALWPLLLERAGDEQVATLEAMEAEHSEIDQILTACHAGFARMVEEPDEDVRAALSVRLTAAREGLGRHLAHEERDAIAIIQRHLSDEDWRTLEEEHFAKGVSFREKLRLLPWLCHAVPEDVLRDVFARIGGPFPVLWRLTRGRFERQHRAAFGH